VFRLEVKKVMKKVVALSAGAAMVGTTLMGAMAASLADYPAPFVQDGKFNGYIVVGDNAKAEDVIGATDIIASLQYQMKTTKQVSTGTGTSSVTVEGDSWQVGTSTKKLELSEDSTKKETIMNVTSSIDATDLNALASGSITPQGKSEAKYDQFLNFHDTTTGYVLYTESDNDITADFLYFPTGTEIATYEMQFKTALESDVDASGNLEDMINKKLTIMGVEYTITSATNAAENATKITLMGGAVNDILEEGQTKSYSVGGKDYEITVSYVATSSAKFTVNGEVSDSLAEGSTYKLSDGTEIGVIDILAQNLAGETDKVEFNLGANKIVLEDTSVEVDGTGEQSLEVNGEDMDYAKVMIDAEDSATVSTSGTIKISNIWVNITAEDTLYVPAGGKLSAQLTEPGALISGNWDIEYLGLSESDTEEIKIDSSSNAKHELQFVDGDGNKVTMPLTYASGASNLRLGDSNANLSLNESYPLKRNDYFVLTYETTADVTGKSWVMQYKGADASSNSNPEIRFKNIGTGEEIKRSYTATAGTTADASIRIGGQTFNVWNATGDTTANFDILVDMDADGKSGINDLLAGLNDTTVEPLYTNSGAMIVFGGDQASVDAAQTMALTISTPDADDYDNLGPTNLVVNLTADSNTRVQVARISGPALITPADEDNVEYGYNSLGAFITRSTPTSGPSELTIAYPKAQRLPQVFITSGETSSTASSSGGTVETQEIVKIDVGAAVLASEVAGEETDNNLILVGGPCANAAASVAMGNPENCAEGFEAGKAMIKLYTHANGKVALLVAGDQAMDTRGACQYVAKYETNKAMFDKATDEIALTVTSLSSISASIPTSE
jgi:hypothetical protein